MNMRVIQTDLPGVLIIEPAVFKDDRGFFLESFNTSRFEDAGLPSMFRQDNHSRSSRGVLRGLHYQLVRPQGKLVTVISGVIYDVAVDIRRDSPHFGRWTALTLDSEFPRYLWVPPGFAHGFCAVSEQADVVYKCTDLYEPGDEHGVRWDDPFLAIPWPVASPLTSPKDRAFPLLNRARTDLPRMAGES